MLDAVATRLAAGGASVLFGQGWDERAWPDPRPPTRAELDRAGGASVPVYLARVDVHSAVVSSALADRIPGLSDRGGLPGRRAAQPGRAPSQPGRGQRPVLRR